MASSSESESKSESARQPRTWPGYLFGVYALVCGVAAIVTESFPYPGWASFTRPMLGVVAIAGGLLLFLRDHSWRALLVFWVLAQVPIWIVDPSGELTRQPFAWFGFTKYQDVTWTNEMLTGLRGYGVNIVAVVLLFVLHRIIGRWWYPVAVRPTWLKLLGLGVKILFVGCVGVCLFLLSLRWGKIGWGQDALMVIDALPPGTEIFSGDKKLGETPLIVTGEKLVEWKLSRPGATPKCSLHPTAPGHGYLLAGASSSLPILFKPPWWCLAPFQTMRTPWGVRATPLLGGSGFATNYHRINLATRNQPGLVLSEVGSNPSRCKAGQPVELAINLRRNPPPPGLPRLPASITGEQARLTVSYWNTTNTSYSSKPVELPPGWAQLSPGQATNHIMQVAGPESPGTYLVQYSCQFLSPANSPRKVAPRSSIIRAYGYIEADR